MASDADDIPSVGGMTNDSGSDSSDYMFDMPSEASMMVMKILPRIILALIALVGLTGNSIVIYIIMRHRDMRTVTNYFVANLAITDITFLVVCVIPTIIIMGAMSWELGEFMCRINYYFQYASVQATCLTLTAMTVDRYYLIVHAVKSRNTRTTLRAVVINVTIWVFSFLIHLPAVIFNKVRHDSVTNVTMCYPKYDWPHGAAFYTIFSICEVYVIPLIIIMGCYVQILLQVWQKTSGGTESAQAHARALRRKKKITRMVFIVVVLFALCWAPIHTMNIMEICATSIIESNYTHAQWWKIFFLMLAYGNSCINPFVYAFTTTSFKKYFKMVFGAACGNYYKKEGHAMSISMETKTERISANQNKEDSSL